MYPILLQAMMALPFGIAFVWLLVAALIYGVMLLDVQNDKKLPADKRRQKTRRRILVATIVATVASIVFTCLIAFAPGPMIN